MSSRPSWRHVIPGLIALALLASIVVVILTYGGVGKIRGDTQKLYVVAAHARGLINGSEVWLSGQKIGMVEKLDFQPFTADSQARLVIVAEVLQSATEQIRRDSKVRIRAGGNFVGPIVLWIETGTPTSPAVTEHDTLHAQMASELEIAGARAARGVDELPALMTEAKRVLAHVKDPNGVRGAFTEPAMAEAKKLMATMRRAAQRTSASDARAVLLANASLALARVDSIRALLASPNGNLGRFRRDSTLPRSIAHVRDELAALQTRMDSSTGTLDRFARDSAVTRAVADARLEMAALFADVRRRPLRYIAF